MKDRTKELEKEVKVLRAEIMEMKKLLGVIVSMIMEEDMEMEGIPTFPEIDMGDFTQPN